jgi:ubiquinone biosynthesis protein UbiJ
VTLDLDLVNRALERESWARDKLAPHAGRIVRMRVGPLVREFTLDSGGRLVAASGEANLTLTLSPLKLPALAAAPERWAELVHAEGDPALAAALRELAATLPWFVEKTFASFLGPIAGQQLADAGRRLLAFPGYASERFSASVARYVGDEAKLAVGVPESRRFTDEVAALAARVDALAARVAALSA